MYVLAVGKVRVIKVKWTPSTAFNAHVNYSLSLVVFGLVRMRNYPGCVGCRSVGSAVSYCSAGQYIMYCK